MASDERMLTFSDHNRDVFGMRYVYPVVSRRAGGVSVGINLNPNNACNWHCVYCQVPNLTRGKAPPIDIDLLCGELTDLLDRITVGTFLRDHVPVGLRQLKDLAFSGNGEPTSAARFDEIVERVGQVRQAAMRGANVPIRLITNGSLVGRSCVMAGLNTLSGLGGEVWFKVDAASPADELRINGIRRRKGAALERLARCAGACPTWIQTCMFAWDGAEPDERAIDAYLGLVAAAKSAGVRGVLLYGVVRPSMQPESLRVSRLPEAWLEGLAERIRNETGLTVSVSP